ncbi:hypothetical protein APUTEX25_001475 [Auxenochlorella protothecoides]|uniref:DUF1736 domain-containing protein n=1 Tax=Auxenochlorella protothecoides TaxID=3075 RepID=A0A3M7KVE6_AUXPR|nr:hypothetical protein APUTEX25_001475 [Auxenochlorella protothecoides]|eukprot:RMZ54317.1 hypothetical protein APUTEX25_001475 [Auxenochlorella protothecoides]
MRAGLVPSLVVPLTLAIAAGLLYANTLQFGFVYDDDFAVDLRSSTSHKSYRPVTTLFFRVLNILGGEWLPWETEEDDPGTGPDPRPFHAANAALHGVLTAQVYWCVGALLGVLALAVAAYVGLRAALAGDHLVRNYRIVENPIPFIPSRLARVLTTLYLHALYARQLILPVQMSADWSFSCVAIVKSMWDPRNALSLLLYAWLLATALAAKPWSLMSDWRRVLASGTGARLPATPSSTSTAEEAGVDAKIQLIVAPGAAPGSALYTARWRLFVTAGLIVGPMLPAANLFFYVGTFLAERLLLMPSGKARWQGGEGQPDCMPWSTLQLLRTGLDQSITPVLAVGLAFLVAEQLTAGLSGPRSTRVRRAFSALILASLLALGGRRTLQRNRDWESDASLFGSALKVCPNSAKVLLNTAILSRRSEAWDVSLVLLDRALDVVPQYCDPHYHRGIALMGKMQMSEGIQELTAALSCPDTAVDALSDLNKVYVNWMDESLTQRDWVQSMDQWAQVLVHPEVQRIEEASLRAAVAWESAALTLVATNQLDESGKRAERLIMKAMMKLDQLEAVSAAPDETHRIRQPASEEGLERLVECMGTRFPVMEAIAAEGGNLTSPTVKAAMYKYLDKAAPLQCHFPLKKVFGEPFASNVQPFHAKLLNAVQKVDAHDPWLQAAWAQALEAQDRGKEGVAHARAALIIFQDAAARLLAGEAAAADADAEGEAGPLPLGRDGGSLEPAAALSAMTSALSDMTALMIRAGYSRKTLCDLQQHAEATLGVLRTLTEGRDDHLALLEAKSIEVWRAAEALGCKPSADAASAATAAAHDEL